MKRMGVILFFLSMLIISVQTIEAIETASRITDREIIEALAELKAGQKSIEQRFEHIDKRLDRLEGFIMWGFGIIFTGMMALIGFVLWDRRSAIAPAIRKNREIEEREERIIKALQEAAIKDDNLLAALKHTGLL